MSAEINELLERYENAAVRYGMSVTMDMDRKHLPTREQNGPRLAVEADATLATLRNDLRARLLSEDALLLAEIRRHCRVVYYPPEVGMYPIEHAPIAGKDMWDAIVYALRGRHQEPPVAARPTEGRDPGGEG